MNAGVLARRQGRLADAERHWTEAVSHDPGLTPVHLYLAELLDEQSARPTTPPGHYRAYLEQVVATARRRPRPIRPR